MERTDAELHSQKFLCLVFQNLSDLGRVSKSMLWDSSFAIIFGKGVRLISG